MNNTVNEIIKIIDRFEKSANENLDRALGRSSLMPENSGFIAGQIVMARAIRMCIKKEIKLNNKGD